MAVDGTWKLTMTTPMGVQEPTLTLASNGGTLTGSLAGPMGTAEIEDGKVDGNNVSWTITPAQMPMKINFSGTVDGDKISGKAEVPAMGESPFEGVRG